MIYPYLIPEGEISQENFAAFSLPAEFAADSHEEEQDMHKVPGAVTGNRGIGEMGEAYHKRA
jgi:hypothetical protein